MCNCIKIKSFGKFERKLHILEASTNLYTLFSMSNPIDFLRVGKISIDISYFNKQIQKVFLEDNNILNKEIIHYPFNKRKTRTKSCIIPHTSKQEIQKHGVGPLGGVFGLYHSTFLPGLEALHLPHYAVLPFSQLKGDCMKDGLKVTEWQSYGIQSPSKPLSFLAVE